MKRYAPNLKLSVSSPTELWNKVIKEVHKGRYAGPFETVPFEFFIQSPIGLVPKDGGKDTRLIFHLSYPRSGHSVNSDTPQDRCKVVYPDFCEVIQLCMELTKNSNTKIVFSGKSDMKSAFRKFNYLAFGLHVTDYEISKSSKWQNLLFSGQMPSIWSFDILQNFPGISNCVAHICTYHTGKKTVNYLDDYYFVALLKSLCDGQINAFLEICNLIAFPVSMEKTVWGVEVIVFLGFLIDALNQTVCVLVDKVHKVINIIKDILDRKSRKVTIHQLQKLCGFLNHLCQCIVPGRAFTRRLYAYTRKNGGVLLPHHHIRVNLDMKVDLQMWLKFLNSPQVYCRPFIDYANELSVDTLFWYTDASKNPLLDLGEFFNGNFSGKSGVSQKPQMEQTQM